MDKIGIDTGNISDHLLYFSKVDKLLRVLDADTVELRVSLPFKCTFTAKFRMKGYDAPETYRPKSDLELSAGLRLTKEFKQILTTYEDNLYVQTFKYGSGIYGRYDAVLYGKTREGYFFNINEYIRDMMIENGWVKSKLRSSE